VREALFRYSTWSGTHNVDVRTVSAADFGDVRDPDGTEGEGRVMLAAAHAANLSKLLVAVGGDNSLTYGVVLGVMSAELPIGGLITLDAHYDLRDGESNGSPVRRLIATGLTGPRIVQIGISDFANSPEYAARARDYGITVVQRDVLRRRPIEDVMAEALVHAGSGGGPVHVDLDVDVCDRAFVPGCPAAAPGGISADELRRAAFVAAKAPHVRSIDIAEIDATSDAPDGRTVRLAALLVLEAAVGLASR
jgi:formiminoglutamase